MNSTERVRNIILGKPVDRQPIYCWTGSRIRDKICSKWGSVEAFQDHYEFDMAHIFGGPRTFKQETLDKIMAENGEVPPDILMESDYYNSPDDPQCFEAVKKNQLNFTRNAVAFVMYRLPAFLNVSTKHLAFKII